MDIEQYLMSNERHFFVMVVHKIIKTFFKYYLISSLRYPVVGLTYMNINSSYDVKKQNIWI